MVKNTIIAHELQEDFYKQVFASIEDYAILVMDSAGIILQCNSAAQALFGYIPEELIGQNSTLIFTKQDKRQKKPQIELEKASLNGKTIDARWHVKKDGTKFWGSGLVFSMKDSGGKVCGFTKIALDLTEQLIARKLAGDELKTKTALLENMVEGISLSTEQGVIVYTNPAEDKMFGYKRGGLVGQHVTVQNTYTPKENLRIVNDVIKQLKKKGVWQGEFSNKKKDGTHFTTFAHITALIIRGKTHWMCVQEDITEKKKAEGVLSFRTALLEAQNKVTLDGVLIVDTKGNILSYNQRFAKMWDMPKKILTSYDDEAALKFAMTQLVDPRAFIDRVNYLYAHPTEASIEEINLKNGKTFERYGAPVKDAEGNSYGWTWQFHDITQRKNAEEKLQASEKQFRQLADSMPQMVWTARADGYLDYYNKQWYDYTGLKEEFEDPSWRTILHPADVDKCITTWQKSVTTGKPYQIESRFIDRRHPGNYRWFLSRALPIKNKEGKIIKWFGTCTDVDDVKRTRKRKDELERIAASLTKQRQQLVDLNEAKDEFISIASHQLRTPATGVKQYVGMLLEGYAGPLIPEQEAFLRSAYESNERQINIVNDLLQVATVDAGKVVLHEQETDLLSLIQNIVKEQESKFAERTQTVILKSKIKNISVVVDSKKMRMVFENIIDNASKYTYKNKTIEISITKSLNSVRVAVKDQGVGIDKPDQEKIFRKFTSIENPLSAAVGGTGIGLYWAKKIVELHGGTIEVSSSLKKGSVFTISMPVHDEK